MTKSTASEGNKKASPQGDLFGTRPHRIGDEERRCKREGIWPVVGTDEVGRGPLAGPVVAAAVLLKDGARLPGLDDSKKLTHAQRVALVPEIERQSLAFAVVEGSVAEITARNILGASMWAMNQAVSQVCAALSEQSVTPALVLVDGNRPIPGFDAVEQRPVVKGDSRSRAIAAASVLAKVYRDNLMAEMATAYPGYGFEVHKGYPTKMHMQALAELGPCPHHRPTFGPVAKLLKVAK
ncbi:MAG: ribonuclease HII [Myxococcales bacterium]|nr:ribonuclease HII [Myxococcales bacterium]